MRVSLINLGDGSRCLYDINNRIVSIPIGEIVSADVSEQTLKNLTKFQKTDTLLVGPEGAFTPPVRLRAILELLKIIDDEPYGSLVRQFLEIHSPRSSLDIRPNRGQMRTILRGIVENYLQQMQADPTKRPEITTDDVGADELEAEQRAVEQQKAEAARRAREQVRRHQGGKRR